MSLSNKKKTQSTSNIFDDDFEVIYEGDLPDISIDDDDDYRDVLSGLSDIDHTDYIKKNDYDRLTKKLKNKNKKAGKTKNKVKKITSLIPPTMMTTSLTSWMMTFTMMNMKTTTIMSMKTTTTILVTTDRKRKKAAKIVV